MLYITMSVCLLIYKYPCTHACINAYIGTSVRTYMYTNMRTCINMSIRTHTHTCLFTYLLTYLLTYLPTYHTHTLTCLSLLRSGGKVRRSFLACTFIHQSCLLNTCTQVECVALTSAACHCHSSTRFAAAAEEKAEAWFAAWLTRLLRSQTFALQE